MELIDIDVAKITSKGQITIPKKVRDALNLGSGDKLSFSRNDRGEVVVKKAMLDTFSELQDFVSMVAQAQGITEDELLEDLKQIRQKGTGKL